MLSPIVRETINWASLPALVGLTCLLVWRRLVRQFPYFFYYVIAGGVIGFIRLGLYDRRSRVYLYAYWITDPLIAIAGVLATYELFIRRLFVRFYAVRFYRYLFPVGALIVVLIAVPATVQLNQLWIVVRAIHVLGVLRVAILLFFVGLMTFMGRQWDRYEFGIALGLGIQASALLVMFANMTLGLFVSASNIALAPLSYDVACLIWLITFSKPEKPQSVPTMPIRPEVLTEARKWQEAAKDSVTGKKDSD